VLVAFEANIPTSGVTSHAPPPSKPYLQTYGRDTRHRPIATSREFLPAGGKKRGKTHKPPAALDAVVPRFPRGGGWISRRRPRPPSLYAASFRSTRGTSPRLDGCIFLYSPVSSSSSRASRRRHDASDGCARRIASRRGRRVRMTMVVIYAFTRRATPRARCARDDDGVARRKYIATRRVARPLAVVRARRAGRGRFRRWDTRRGDYIIPSPSSKASTTPRGWVMSQDSWIVDKTPRRRGETRTRDGVIRLIQGEARD